MLLLVLVALCGLWLWPSKRVVFTRLSASSATSSCAHQPSELEHTRLQIPRNRTNKTYLRDEGVLWMWLSHGKEIRGDSLKEFFSSAWSVKANSRKENGEQENFHTTLLCDQNIYSLLHSSPLRNLTSQLLDNIVVFDASKYLEERFSGNLKEGDKSTLYMEKSLLGLLSPYYRTLFLDVDVMVVNPKYIRSMLDFVKGENGFDLVQPQIWALRDGEYTDRLPVGCTCIMAFRNSEAALHLMEDWVRATYYEIENPPPDYVERDQEILWWILLSRKADLKYFQLPLEYQCPLSENIEDMWTYRTKKRRYQGGFENLHEVPCKVIHSHGIVSATRDHYCKKGERQLIGAGVNVCDMLTTLEAYK